MAYISKLPSGLWRAQIARKGVRTSKTFTTKAAAVAWATREESALIDGTASRWPKKTLGDALNRYEREVSALKRSRRFEEVAFGLLRREYPALCATPLHQITAADLAAWRDDRLKHVSGSTVNRYISSLRHVWTVAAREWLWTPEPTPWRAVRKPPENAPREAMIGWRQARAILRRLNYSTGIPPATKMQQAAYALLIALRTAMRASEVLSLTTQTVDLASRVVTLPHHKTIKATGRARKVPITKQAARLLAILARGKSGPLFDLRAGSLDALFRKARDQAMVTGVHFHDSRATALTLLARRVDLLTLARISGHRDISMLSNVYFREADADIALRM